MWIQCVCGNQIKDTTDGISYKARYISDQDWFEVLDKIASLIESNQADRKTLCREFYGFFGGKTKAMYQCTGCGRLFVEDKNGEMREFVSTENIGESIFKSR